MLMDSKNILNDFFKESIEMIFLNGFIKEVEKEELFKLLVLIKFYWIDCVV